MIQIRLDVPATANKSYDRSLTTMELSCIKKKILLMACTLRLTSIQHRHSFIVFLRSHLLAFVAKILLCNDYWCSEVT